jgi:hypothetical protein
MRGALMGAKNIRAEGVYFAAESPCGVFLK